MASKLITGLAIMSLIILLLVLVLRRLNQPYFVAYIFAGILLGPEFLAIFDRSDSITGIGELGVVLLMFFVGAEIDLSALTRRFFRPLAAALIQVGFSFLFIYLLSFYFGWNTKVVVLLSFIISLSSSAIVFQYLGKNNEMHTSLGLLAGSVLLLQDILVVPMMLILNITAGHAMPLLEILKVCCGALFCVVFLWAAVARKMFRIPLMTELGEDHDLQVFVGFLLCFGMAWITWFFGLSPALGAFMAGIFIGQDRSTHWLDNALTPFRVFFLAFFFISVGLQINIRFFAGNLLVIGALALGVLLINSLINALVFRMTGQTWRDSVYAGALLSQIGEFSFVLVTLAKELGTVNESVHQITLAVIALTMMLSTIWIKIIQAFIFKSATIIKLPLGK